MERLNFMSNFWWWIERLCKTFWPYRIRYLVQEIPNKIEINKFASMLPKTLEHNEKCKKPQDFSKMLNLYNYSSNYSNRNWFESQYFCLLSTLCPFFRDMKDCKRPMLSINLKMYVKRKMWACTNSTTK